MPLTPFHLGPAIFFGLILSSYVNFPTFLIANFIPDIEGVLVLFLNLDYPLHGYMHSLAGGTISALILSLIMIKLNEPVQGTMRLFRLQQEKNNRQIFLGALLGVYLHILIDSPLYSDIRPFYPVNTNPLNGLLTSIEMMGICVILFFMGAVLYVYRLCRHG